jgi:hypothetical protein
MPTKVFDDDFDFDDDDDYDESDFGFPRQHFRCRTTASVRNQRGG